MDLTGQATELLRTADACHDEDPPRGAELLRQIDADALNPGQRPLFAFLLNHVLGEKLGLHAEAWTRMRAVLAASGDEAALPLLRHAGVAARQAGDQAAEQGLVARLAAVTQVDTPRAAELIVLAAAGFEIPRLPGEAAARVALAALAPLERHTAWREASGLDGAAAAMTNNIASDLAERPVAELALPPLREAMARAAEWSQSFWHRAGQWVNHARAHYLRAFVANALGDATTAESQARAGLVLLTNFDTEGHEKVDEAFLRSELSHALTRLGRAVDAQVERAQADATIEAVNEEGITRWYRSRVARQQALDAAA